MNIHISIPFPMICLLRYLEMIHLLHNKQPAVICELFIQINCVNQKNRRGDRFYWQVASHQNCVNKSIGLLLGSFWRTYIETVLTKRGLRWSLRLPWNLAGKKTSVAGFHIAVSIPFKTPKYLQNCINIGR